jgi:threonine dehydratase
VEKAKAGKALSGCSIQPRASKFLPESHPDRFVPPTVASALRAGKPVDAEAGGIAADSLAPRRVGELMFPIAQSFVDRVVLVTDEAIQRSQLARWEVLRIAAEPGGAAALAALLSGQYKPASGERVGVLVCGGNTTAVDFRAAF